MLFEETLKDFEKNLRILQNKKSMLWSQSDSVRLYKIGQKESLIVKGLSRVTQNNWKRIWYAGCRKTSEMLIQVNETNILFGAYYKPVRIADPMGFQAKN